MPVRKPSPKPWPMKWIVVAIIVCVIPYTWITLRHRKPGPAYLPYADNKARAEVMRLLDAGYRRTDLPVEVGAGPASVARGESSTTGARPGGLPPLLSEVLIDTPRMPETIHAVQAPARSASDADMLIHFTCTPPNAPDAEEALTRVILFARDGEITLVPAFETPPDSPSVRGGDITATATLPAGTLKPGNYRFTLVAASGSRTWDVELH